ncbi:MAG: hypothetical protein LBI88_02715 [Deltaproteobacteria bacterium]|nr:hypothetical protein [Deltaproteobacteria bacterium]
MAQKTLRDVLGPRPEDTSVLRWQTAVPMGTNPFLLIELFQFAFVGAAVVLLTLCVGVWFTEGSISTTDITVSLGVAGMVLLAVMAGFIGISLLFFDNKYYAIYHMDSDGIYHEGTRGNDERKEVFCLRLRPFPVVGAVRADRTRSRHLTWDKIDRFQDIASMRGILLRRGRGHMLRLYTPDAETHGEVVRYLAERLRHI